MVSTFTDSSAGTSWYDIPNDVLEVFVLEQTRISGILQLAGLCRESRHAASVMAERLFQPLDNAELPASLSLTYQESAPPSSRRNLSSLSLLQQLLEGVPSSDGSCTVYLDPTTENLFSIPPRPSTSPPSSPKPRADCRQHETSPMILLRHMDSPLPLTEAVLDRASNVLAILDPIVHYFPSFCPSIPQLDRVKSLLRGAQSTNPGYLLSWDPTSSSVSFHVAAAALKTSPGYQALPQCSISGSRFPNSLHLSNATNFVSPFDIHFPFPIPEGQATLNWVTARDSAEASVQKDKVFAQCEYSMDLCSTVNLSATGVKGALDSREVKALSTVLCGRGSSHLWSWETVKAGSLRVKGKDGWAVKHLGEACVYGKGTEGLYLDSLVLKIRV